MGTLLKRPFQQCPNLVVEAVSPSRDDRLEQLELKLAYLERGSQELSDAAYSQCQIPITLQAMPK